MRIHVAAMLAAVALPAAALADDETPPVKGGRTWVQHQVLEAKAKYPQIASIVVEGARPDDRTPVILGSTVSAVQVFTPARDVADAETAVRKGNRYVVREPFVSSTAHRLGTIEIAFPYRPTELARDRQIAHAVQARMARQTLSAKNAVDPYPFDPAFGPGTYAQKLTERTIVAHPDLLVMMIHATPPGGKRNVIIGSNIGRLGKPADEDDLRVIDKGSTNLEVSDGNDRFETELPLNDASGQRIGALGLVFPYKASDDKEALHRHGLAIRDEIARAIPNNAALFRPAR